jgi:hypothetical protein
LVPVNGREILFQDCCSTCFVDAILRFVDAELPHLMDRVPKVFYADDSRMGGKDATKVQEVQDLVNDLF